MTDRPVDDSLDLVWGAREIAKTINLKSTKTAFRLLEAGQLPATKVGRSWVASRAKLRARFGLAMEDASA